MGWASGSSLCEDICRDIKQHIPEECYEKVSAIICKHFVGCDADDFECYEGMPYWNYLKLFEPEEFEEYLREQEEED